MVKGAASLFFENGPSLWAGTEDIVQVIQTPKKCWNVGTWLCGMYSNLQCQCGAPLMSSVSSLIFHGQSCHWILQTARNVQLHPTDHSPSGKHQESHHILMSNKLHTPFLQYFFQNSISTEIYELNLRLWAKVMGHSGAWSFLLHFSQMIIKHRIVLATSSTVPRKLPSRTPPSVSVLPLNGKFLEARKRVTSNILSRIALFLSTSSWISCCRWLSIPLASIKE